MNYHPPFIAPSALDERHIEIRQWCYVVVINDSWSFSKWCTYADKTCPPFPYIQGSPFPTFMPFLSAQPRSPRSFSWGIPSQTSRGTSSCCKMQGPGTLIPLGKKGLGPWIGNCQKWKILLQLFTHHSSIHILIGLYGSLVHFDACFGLNSVWTVPLQIESTDSVAIFKRIHVTSCNIPYKIS